MSYCIAIQRTKPGDTERLYLDTHNDAGVVYDLVVLHDSDAQFVLMIDNGTNETLRRFKRKSVVTLPDPVDPLIESSDIADELIRRC